MLYKKDKGEARKKLGRFFSSITDRFSMDITDLIRAVDKNDTETVLRAMNAGMDPNERDGINRLALPMAIDNLNVDMIAMLLAGGANPNLPGMDGETSLYKAVTWQDEPIVKMLLKMGADPNLATAAGISPMQAAQKIGNEAILNLLVKPSEATNTTETPATKISTPLELPKEESSTSTPKVIRKEEPKPIPKKHRIPSSTTQQQEKEVAKSIELAEQTMARTKELEEKIKVATSKKTTKKAATKKETPTKQPAAKEEIVKETSKQVPATKKTTTTKKKAPAKGVTQLVPYLKEAEGMAGALVMAIQKEDEKAVDILLETIKQKDFDKVDTATGLTPLLAALEKKNAKATGALIDKGADVLTVVATKQHSPLSLAVSMGSDKLVKFMIERSDAEKVKAALNNKDTFLSAQFLAYNQPKLLNVLLTAGADPNFGGTEGTSPLLKGLEKGSIGLLPLYAKHQLDMNQIVEGKSLLEWAIKYNRMEWVNGLLAEGADPTIKNKNNQTALEYAVSFGGARKEMEALLQS